MPLLSFIREDLGLNNFQEAFSALFCRIENCEKMQGFLQDSNQIKISFADMHVYPYKQFSELFRYAGKPKDAYLPSKLQLLGKYLL